MEGVDEASHFESSDNIVLFEMIEIRLNGEIESRRLQC